MGSAEPAKFRDLRNGNCSKVGSVLSTGTRKSFFLTRPLKLAFLLVFADPLEILDSV